MLDDTGNANPDFELTGPFWPCAADSAATASTKADNIEV
jgi:hypothetical protein